MNRFSIGMMAIVAIATLVGQSTGQGVVRLVPDESSSVHHEANRPSPSDLVMPTGLNSEFKEEALQRDNGVWKDGGSQFGCEPLWSVYAGAVILRRENPDVAGPLDLGLGLGDALPALPGIDVGFRAGVDIDVRRRLGERHALQVRYFGVDGWSDQWTDSGTIQLNGGFTDWERFAGYATRLHSTEMNLRSRWTDRVTVLGGFRWVELNEKADYQVDTVTTIPDPDNDFIITPANSAQRARTYNNMYGFQLGTDVLLWDRGGPFTVNTDLKAGIYSNLAKNAGSLESPDVDFNFVGEGRKYDTAFLGELGINTKYQLTNNWALLAGYQLVWVEGVALVNDNQIVALEAGDVDTSGSAFYHGARVGAELRW